MQIGYNEIMIVSKYFEDINDFINLEIGVKRFQGNMERFHFNPIQLNQYSRKLFPNIETFHIYNKEDKIFKDGKIFKQIIWYKVNYSRYLKEKEEMNEYKNIEYTQEDRKKYGNTIPIEVNSIGEYCFCECYDIQSINIPINVSKIGNECFRWCLSLTTINIPTSVSKIGDYCFEGCTSLTSINIQSSITSFGYGCFYHCGCEKE
ncbi:Leucine rich repeats (6 copies), putative [Entamoeba histolytica]